MPGREDIAVKQSIPAHLRYTINHFNNEFPTDDACLAYIAEQRYPGGITPCEKCQKETKHHRITGRTAYSCDHCGTHIYPLAGTIFEKTSTSLRLWLCHASDELDPLRNFRKADPARNWRCPTRLRGACSNRSVRFCPMGICNWRDRRLRWTKPTTAVVCAGKAKALTCATRPVSRASWSVRVR